MWRDEKKGVSAVMPLADLCRSIGIQEEMAQRVEQFSASVDWSAAQEQMRGLFSRRTWDGARMALKAWLGEDPDGVGILACMLQCARYTREHYRQMGIPEQVFIDTFRCFRRFIGEHTASYGRPAFDRDWWTARQVAMEIFRLGELEYEKTSLEGRRAVSIHIPSDAVLDLPALERSYRQAQAFFARYYPAFEDAVWFCHSWLLEPALKEILPGGARILDFQRAFSVIRIDYGAPDFIEWVFKNPNLSIAEYPEDTTLQRNLKQYLLAGGQIGEALGILKDGAFQ